MEYKAEDFYKRQTTLPKIGHQGQNKLREAKVVVIGCGGLGSIAATYLAASGIGQIHLVDFDRIDISNLHRQVFYSPKDVGKLKAKRLAKYLKSIAPLVSTTWEKTLINKSNCSEIIEKYEYVLDCTDHLPTKYLINDVCVLENKKLIYGSLYKYTGYVASFNIEDGENRTTNLRDAFPEIPTENIPNCAQIGTLNTIVGIIGLQQVNEVIKLITGIGKPLVNCLYIYNSLNNSQHTIKIKPTIGLSQIKIIFENSLYVDNIISDQREDWVISNTELKKLILKESDHEIISVIEDISTSLPFEVDKKIPFSKFEELSTFIGKRLSRNKVFIVVCQRGISSYMATEKLKTLYPSAKILSLNNGINKY